MHTLLFLEPGHFHATLTLRVPHPRVADEIVVYATDGPELRDFLALVERFNGRADRPTRWRPVVVTDDDPLGRLVAERKGDAVVLAGRNGGKARTIRRLHAAGFHVLADKPWLVEPADLEDIRSSLGGWPLAVEIMTGRHDLAARCFKRLVDAPPLFGTFADVEPAVELDGAHHLHKLVDGVPLRRPWWFFDVRVQGNGIVDIPTHFVDQTQWLLDGVDPAARLVSARAWPTRVPEDAFRRITGETAFPRALARFVERGALDYLCNAELVYRLGGVTARGATRWDLSPTPAAGDAHSVIAHGTRADLVLEQGPHTGYRRRLFVAPRGDAADAGRAVAETLADVAGLGVAWSGAGRYEVTIPAGLDAGHESHFTRVLDDFVRTIDDDGRWPAAIAARTLAKYTLLAEAAARIQTPDAMPTEERR
jgi:predicted dehydrogenase